MCATTPADLHGLHFDGPKYCDDRVSYGHPPQLFHCTKVTNRGSGEFMVYGSLKTETAERMMAFTLPGVRLECLRLTVWKFLLFRDRSLYKSCRFVFLITKASRGQLWFKHTYIEYTVKKTNSPVIKHRVTFSRRQRWVTGGAEKELSESFHLQRPI